jgi:hypothetical protein
MKFREGGREIWDRAAAVNTDWYGRGVIKYAQVWATLMEKELATGASLFAVASPTSHEADTMGMSGFGYDLAVKLLVDCWEHGDALRRWHNREYDYTGPGVVNPALMTVQG